MSGETLRDVAFRLVDIGLERVPVDGRVISEAEFADAIKAKLMTINPVHVDYITGPGRSGAIASVYASHILGRPFVPFKSGLEDIDGHLLIIDTAKASGRTIKKAVAWYTKWCPRLYIGAMAIFNEPPRVRFWYETRRLAGEKEYV